MSVKSHTSPGVVPFSGQVEMPVSEGDEGLGRRLKRVSLAGVRAEASHL
jgi:hypothetical protein